MPRPFPGGKSTWVGSTSLSGELNVPTWAMSGGLREAAIIKGALPASIAEVFRNERREIYVVARINMYLNQVAKPVTHCLFIDPVRSLPPARGVSHIDKSTARNFLL